MPSDQQSWFTPGLRFCGSCLVSLLYWAAWLSLCASLAVLVYILVAKELPVPDFVLRKAEARFAEANLTMKFGSARLDPTGKILLKEVQLRSKQFEEPLLTSRLVFVRRSFWSVLSGRPIPDEIRLEGATLQLPAMLSPSGTAEPVVNDLCAVLRHDDNIWHVDQLTGRIGRLKVTMHGDVSGPSHAAGAPKTAPEAIVARFLKIGRNLILQANRFEAFEEPAVDVYLDSQAGIGNVATLVFTANSAREPWSQPLALGAMTISGTLRLDGTGARTARLYGTVKSLGQRDRFTSENVSAMLSAWVDPEIFSIKPIEVMLSAGSLAADGERVEAPLLRADLRSWPAIKISPTLQIAGDLIDAEIDARLDERSARVFLSGTGSPEVINRVLAKHTPRAAPYFVFADPVTVTAEAVLSRGWHFEKLSSRVKAGRIDSRGVKITSATGRIDIEGMNFLAHDALVKMAESSAQGSYWMNFASTDYRMLLTGRLRPQKINGWFGGEWWSNFWNEHFDFPTVLPEGDVDVQGRWRDATRTEYFGRAEAKVAGVWGGKFDQVSATVFLRPFYTHVVEFSGVRADGAQKLSGNLKRNSDPKRRETQQLEFDLEGNVDPQTYHGMLDGKADEVLATLRFSSPPAVRAQGTIEINGSGAVPNYTFTGQSVGGIHYYDFPIESVRVAGAVKGAEVRLDDIQFEALGGKGAGKAAVSGPPEKRRLGFDFYLNGADLARTIRTVQEFQKSRAGPNAEPVAVADSAFMKRAAGGRLDIALSAQGTPDSLSSFAGTGNAALTGANLGEIQLFGLLSQALSGLSLNFSSLKLDSAHTSFRMENGRLRFPDLKITGPSAVIDARGDFVFATTALDFTAKFKPFEENRTLLTAAIGIVINPITSILELKLTGPLNKPDWSIDVGSSSVPHPDTTVRKESSAEPSPQTPPKQSPAPRD